MKTLEDSIGEAYDALEAGEPIPEPAPEPAAEAESVETAPEASAEPEPTKAERARDESGKFKAKAPTITKKAVAPLQTSATAPAPAQAKADGAASPQVAPSAEPQPASPKAPASWKPAAREEWTKVPPAVQAEVERREKEITQGLERVANANKALGQLQEVMSPYKAMIQAEGGNALGVIRDTLQTAAILRSGAPAIKAKFMAMAIKQYGVPIDMLDAELSGQAPAGGQQGQLDPETLVRQAEERAYQRYMKESQAAQSAQKQQWADQQIAQLRQKHEFWDDVEHEVGALLEAAQSRGRALTVEDAYNRAIRADPDLSKIVEQREAAKTAATAQAATQRARTAAGIKPSPAMPVRTGTRPMTDHEAVAAAYDALNGR